VEIEFADTEEIFLTLEVDFDAGLDLAFTAAGLEFTLVTPGAAGIQVVVTKNDLGSDEEALIFASQHLFPFFAPELEDAIQAFPIPALLGLDLDPVEVACLGGGFIGLFANLVPTPTTHVENVTFTDLSSGDFREQGGCWLREWRHRLSGNAFGNSISANMRGMLGADAGCTTNDAESVSTVSYRVNFDVASVPGEQWQSEHRRRRPPCDDPALLLTESLSKRTPRCSEPTMRSTQSRETAA
jgi:hypothetical protein